MKFKIGLQVWWLSALKSLPLLSINAPKSVIFSFVFFILFYTVVRGRIIGKVAHSNRDNGRTTMDVAPVDIDEGTTAYVVKVERIYKGEGVMGLQRHVEVMMMRRDKECALKRLRKGHVYIFTGRFHHDVINTFLGVALLKSQSPDLWHSASVLQINILEPQQFFKTYVFLENWISTKKINLLWVHHKSVFFKFTLKLVFSLAAEKI